MGDGFHSDEYLAYLQSPQWRERKARYIRNHGYWCRGCWARKNLQLHNSSYENLFNEPDRDLWLICGKCHQLAHIYDRRPILWWRRYPTLRAVTHFAIKDAQKQRRKAIRRRRAAYNLYQRGYCYLALGRLVV